MEPPFSSASRRSNFIFNNNNNTTISCYTEQSNAMMEKRQLFLRSYQFSRKRSVSDRIKGFGVKLKRVILFRLRSVKKLRKLAWSALCSRRRRFRFLRLVNSDVSCFDAAGMRHKSSCLW